MANNRVGQIDKFQNAKISRKIVATKPTQIPLQIAVAGSQSANAIEVLGTSGSVVWSVDASGNVAVGAGSIGSAELHETTVRYAEVSISNTELLAIRATPKELVAAPGAGKVLEFISAQLIFDYTAAYTESDDNLAVKYENGSGVQVSETIECTNFLDATADTLTNAIAKADAIVAASGSVNKALVLHGTGNGEFGGGNAANAVRVKVAYRVHTTGL